MPLTKDSLPVSLGQTVYKIQSSRIEKKQFSTGMISELYFADYSNAVKALSESINSDDQRLDEIRFIARTDLRLENLNLVD